MVGLLKYVYLLAVAIWVGEIVFFSFVGAPSIFRTLPVVDAGRVVAVIFPTYYVLGMVCGGVAVVAAGVLWGRGGGGTWAVATAVLLVMLVLTVYAGMVVSPRAAELRETMHAGGVPAEASPSKPEFDHLHRLAVQLNAGVLVLGLVVIGTTAIVLRP